MRIAGIGERLDLPWADAADPTGLSSPTGQVVILAGLLAALAVLIVQWRRRR